MGRTALIVVVPEAEANATIRETRLRHDSSAARRAPAHITLLFPLAHSSDVDEQALAKLFAGHAALDFILDRVERWDDGIVWLHPEPSQPFEGLDDCYLPRLPRPPTIRRHHRQHRPPLDGERTPTPLELDLPIRSRADAVTLIEEANAGTWSTRCVFPLG